MLDAARKKGEAISVGLVGNCADVLPELVRAARFPIFSPIRPARTIALNGYVPNGMTLAEARALRCENPDEYVRRSIDAMGEHVRAMLALKRMGAVTFDYGNNLRTQAKRAGVDDAFEIPGFVPEYIRPLFCEGRGPFRWAALSGDPQRISRVTDRLALELFPKNETLKRWMKLASEKIQFQGLPARICWLGYGERAEFGLAMNDLIQRGKIAAPMVIGRDHLDTGSVASPYRETEAMLDGSDAIADWPLAERDGQHGRRRVLGFDSQRRRRGHRIRAARGHGGGRRRNRRLRAPPGARADHRSRHRRDSPRRRRL